MKIEFSRNINAQTALLKYTSDRNYFSSPLSYSVASDKADEFVGKYNKQTSVLSKFCTFSTLGCALAGWLGTSKKSKLVKPILNSIAGSLIGFILSSYFAYKLNVRLMDKYDVHEYIA